MCEHFSSAFTTVLSIALCISGCFGQRARLSVRDQVIKIEEDDGVGDVSVWSRNGARVLDVDSYVLSSKEVCAVLALKRSWVS